MHSNRELSVDIAKGLGIILVVLGHTVAAWGGEQETLHRFIYSFHMPLFFGLSGLYISNHSSMGAFLKTKLARFVIPFFFWIIFYFLLYMILHLTKFILQDFVSINKVPAIMDYQTLKNLFIVPFMANWSVIKNAGIFVDLWFLPAVISIVILYKFICVNLDHKKKFTILFITTFISYAVVSLNNMYNFHSNIPWSIDVALVCLPFLVIANYRSYVTKLHWLAIPFLIFIIYYISKDMTVEVAGLQIDNYPLFYITAICGMALIFLISITLQKTPIGNMLSAIGSRTYLIFVIQGLVFIIFKPLLSRLPVLGANEILFNSALFLIALTCGYVFYPYVYKYKHLRFLALGQK